MSGTCAGLLSVQMYCCVCCSDSSLISAALAVPYISLAFQAIDSNWLQAWDFYYKDIDLNFIVRPITLGGKQRTGSWLR